MNQLATSDSGLMIVLHNTSTDLLEEYLVLWYGEVDGEEPWGERGAECVAIHEGNLGANRLVLEEVLLGRNHVCQNLLVGLHDVCD